MERRNYRAAVKELKLNHHDKETQLSTIYTYYGDLS